MDKPFPAYEGDEPFVFVCYSHEDAAAVYPDLAWLHEQGVNVWYDEGIPAGENWRANIGRALLDASHVLIYLSRSSLLSDHCNREINLALDEAKAVGHHATQQLGQPGDLRGRGTRFKGRRQ